MELSAFLAQVPLFAGLDEEALRALAGCCRERPTSRGALLFAEGEEASGLYLMREGRVKIFRSGPDGREAVLHVFGPGEPFGEAAVFQGGSFPASAQSLDNGRVIFLPRAALLESITKDPSLALRMLAALSLRLRAFAARIETLTLLETPQRLAAYLLLASEEQGGSERVSLDVSKALLAGLLGAARETVSRSLARLVEQKIISVDGRTVLLRDRAALEALVRGVENL